MAAAEPVLLWGIKESFRRYLARQPGVEVSVGGGAGYTNSAEFSFPMVQGRNLGTDGGSFTLEFEGDVRIRAHGGVLDVVFAEPRIEVERTHAVLTVAGTGPSHDRCARTVIAILDWCRRDRDESMSSTVPTRLAGTGTWIFDDIYPVGTPLDPVRIRELRVVG